MKMDEKLENRNGKSGVSFFYPGILKMICLVKWVIIY